MAKDEAKVRFQAETSGFQESIKELFWSSDILTGSQTEKGSAMENYSFGAVTF